MTSFAACSVGGGDDGSSRESSPRHTGGASVVNPDCGLKTRQWKEDRWRYEIWSPLLMLSEKADHNGGHNQS